MWGDANMAFHYTPVWRLFLDQNSLRCLTQLTVNDSLKSMYLYTDPILTAAKKYRCRCEGLCNEYVINGESTNSEGYQQRNVSIINLF